MSLSLIIGLVGIVLTIFSIIFSIYMAVWSSYGLRNILIELVESVGEVEEKTSKIDQAVDRHVDNLMDLLRSFIEQQLEEGGGTFEYKLENLGKIKISIDHFSENEVKFRIRSEERIFKPELLTRKANESKDFLRKEKELFGEKDVRMGGVLPPLLRLTIPSGEREKASEFLTFFLNWIDTEYYESLQELEEWEKELKDKIE